MRDKLKPVLWVLAVFPALALAGIAAGIGLFYYMFSLPEPEGLSIASWPQMFTDNFSVWMDAGGDGTVEIKAVGLERLDEYGLWLQVIDEAGQEIFSHGKPEGYPGSYTASELLSLSRRPYDGGYTVFAGADGPYSYLIGFPYAVGKYTLYYNGERIARLSPAAQGVLLAALAALAVLILGWGFWLSGHLVRVTEGVRGIARRTYRPVREAGVFREVYAALNRTDGSLRESEQIKEAVDRARREWIANITHDLKTPLSPVKGYAELLSDGQALPPETVRKYGSIILKNVERAEGLMDDLRLIWQIDSGAVPFQPQEVRLVCLLREVLVDIINDPAFSRREVELTDSGWERTVSLDPALFRRVVQNLVINALVHNPAGTRVTVSAGPAETGCVFLSVRDDGAGIGPEEQAKLFTRYYRGNGEKPEGTGLGLAIARQIVELHGGEITVRSEPGLGTEFVVLLPG